MNLATVRGFVCTDIYANFTHLAGVIAALLGVRLFREIKANLPKDRDGKSRVDDSLTKQLLQTLTAP